MGTAKKLRQVLEGNGAGSSMMSSETKLYLSAPDLRGRERELLLEALESNWIAPLGPHVDAFERELCSYVGVENGLALSSGTAALHLALLALGVGAGDTVLVSTLTFVASANAVRYVGASPIFIDADTATWNMCPRRLEEALASCKRRGVLPKAIVAVDLYGQCANYIALEEVARAYSVPIIEDAAEALGAEHSGKKAGSFGAMGVFSFNGNKIITTSGGGMLVSDNPERIEYARYLSAQARRPVLHYEHEEVGYNYRLSNLLAALGRAQLETLDSRIGRKRSIRRRYREALEALPGIAAMPEASSGRSNAWLTCITVEHQRFGAERDDIIGALTARNVEARPVWKPMHLQPLFRDCERYGGGVAEHLFNTGICLPSGSALTDADVDRVTNAIAGMRPAR